MIRVGIGWRKYKAMYRFGAASVVCALGVLHVVAAAAPSRIRVAAPLHNRHYASRHNVKLIWWNPYKAPSEITPQDLANGGQAFDGFVVQKVKGTQDGSGEQFAWCAFTDKQYTLDGSGDDLGASLTALKGLPSTPMPDRFLRINVCPYKTTLNWLDDSFWNNVASNLAVASKICHDAGLRGIFLDTEPYNASILGYNAFKDDPKYGGMSFDDVSAVVEKRGAQMMRALNSQSPNIKIIISFGYITVSEHVNRSQISRVGALLPAFLDGMLSGATPSTSFIDGAELSYQHDDDPRFFSKWRHAILDIDYYNGKFQKYPDLYSRQYEVGFAIFLDRHRPVGKHANVYGWCGDNKPEMFYSPQRLAFTVQQAVGSSDEYVWVYTQKPDAWLLPGTDGALPTAYVQALRDGQEHGNDNSMPSLPPNTDTAAESDVCNK